MLSLRATMRSLALVFLARAALPAAPAAVETSGARPPLRTLSLLPLAIGVGFGAWAGYSYATSLWYYRKLVAGAPETNTDGGSSYARLGSAAQTNAAIGSAVALASIGG